jgi:LysM repeat protein
MKKTCRKILATTLAISIIGGSSVSFASTYEIKPGDTFWKISQKFGVNLQELMKVNNADENTILYIGDTITIPDNEQSSYYEVKSGDTPWLISQRFGVSLYELLKINNLNENSIIYVGQKLKIPGMSQTDIKIPEQPNISVTYIKHTIQPGDDFWKLSLKYGIPVHELMKVNKVNTNTVLYVGQQITIPVHHVPVMKTLGSKYGEYLDCWTGVQYVIPIGSEIKIIDFYTGKSFMAKRTAGANHADVETLTAKDTEIMKEIWGGSFNWTRRPVIVEYNGRRIAGSASGMPHAGNDNAQGGEYTSWRSGNYGAGINLDYVKGNNMNGHFDIHFLNSTKHKDGLVDEKHQNNIKISAGIIR